MLFVSVQDMNSHAKQHYLLLNISAECKQKHILVLLLFNVKTPLNKKLLYYAKLNYSELNHIKILCMYISAHHSLRRCTLINRIIYKNFVDGLKEYKLA